MKRVLLLIMVVAILLLAIQPLSAQASGIELPINGAFIDADGDDIPDGWEGHDLAATDGVKCKSVCSFIFQGSTNQRMLTIMVDAPEAFTPQGRRITLTADIKFSSIGPNSYMQILGMHGKHLTTNYLMVIPQGVKQQRKLTISGVVQGSGADRFYTVLTITGGKMKLTDANLTVTSASIALPESEPVAQCNHPGISEWRLNKERVIYDDYHGWTMKCYYNTPVAEFPLDTKQLCPVVIDAWTRVKYAIHDDPLRVRCVYLQNTEPVGR